MASILVADDDTSLVDILKFMFTRAEFEVLSATSAPTALHQIQERQPDLAILEVIIGPWNGFDLLAQIRQMSQMPVIFLSSRGSEVDKVRGLRLGADDYVTKPFRPNELMARIHALLRRARRGVPKKHEERLCVGPLVLNRPEHSVTMEGVGVSLTPTEFRLLDYLMRNVNRPIAWAELSLHVWTGPRSATSRDAVRVVAHRLRHKLQRNVTSGRLLHTVPGVGIVLRPLDRPLL